MAVGLRSAEAGSSTVESTEIRKTPHAKAGTLRLLGTIYQGTLSEPCRTVPTFQEADVESIVRDNAASLRIADFGFEGEI